MGEHGRSSLATLGKLRFNTCLPNQSSVDAPAPWPSNPEMLQEASAAHRKSFKL